MWCVVCVGVGVTGKPGTQQGTGNQEPPEPGTQQELENKNPRRRRTQKTPAAGNQIIRKNPTEAENISTREYYIENTLQQSPESRNFLAGGTTILTLVTFSLDVYILYFEVVDLLYTETHGDTAPRRPDFLYRVTQNSEDMQQFVAPIDSFLRILPPIHPTSVSTIEYTALNGGDGGGNDARPSVIELEVPDDADPSFSSLHDDSYGVLRYEFQRILDADASQAAVFEVAAKDKVLGTFDGINSTIFAYGPTGSGKTYTVFGGESFQDRGLIPRAISCLFKEYRVRKIQGSAVRCRVSFTEVYKEAVYDLLDAKRRAVQAASDHLPHPIPRSPAIQVLESSGGITLRGVDVAEVESEDEALSLFFLGSASRHTAATSINAKSSRSHAIFTMIVECVDARANGSTVTTAGKVNFVDLAGSERLSRSTSGSSNSSSEARDAAEEARSNNLALHYLENVIVALRDRRASNRGHVPYRNSTLTSVLRDSLGGNCRTAFILTASMARAAFEEAVSTCRFGQRLADINTKGLVNASTAPADPEKVYDALLRDADRRCELLEDEKALVRAEAATVRDAHEACLQALDEEKCARDAEREAFREKWALRALTAQERTDCKDLLQRLLETAKGAAAVTADEADDARSRGLPPAKVVPRASAAMAASQKDFHAALGRVDRAALVELGAAMSGVLQSLVHDRERARIAEHRRQQKKRLEGGEVPTASDLLSWERPDVLLSSAAHASERTYQSFYDTIPPAELGEALAAMESSAGGSSSGGSSSGSSGGPVPAWPGPPWTPSTPFISDASWQTPGAGGGDFDVEVVPPYPDPASSALPPPPSLPSSSSSGAGVRTPASRPRVQLYEDVYAMLVRGDSFFVSNWLGVRSSKHFYVSADLKSLCWRQAATVSHDFKPAASVPFSTFTKVTLDETQQKRGLYVVTLQAAGGRGDKKSLVLEYQTPNADKAQRWFMALSLCVDKAQGLVDIVR